MRQNILARSLRFDLIHIRKAHRSALVRMVVPKSVPSILPALLIELWPAEERHDDRSSQTDIMDEAELASLVGDVEEARSLHGACPVPELH